MGEVFTAGHLTLCFCYNFKPLINIKNFSSPHFFMKNYSYSINLYIYLSLYLSNYLSLYLSNYLTIYLPVGTPGGLVGLGPSEGVVGLVDGAPGEGEVGEGRAPREVGWVPRVERRQRAIVPATLHTCLFLKPGFHSVY